MSNGVQNAVDKLRRDLRERSSTAQRNYATLYEKELASVIPSSRKSLNEVLARIGFDRHSTVEVGAAPQSGLPYNLVKERELLT